MTKNPEEFLKELTEAKDSPLDKRAVSEEILQAFGGLKGLAHELKLVHQTAKINGNDQVASRILLAISSLASAATDEVSTVGDMSTEDLEAAIGKIMKKEKPEQTG